MSIIVVEGIDGCGKTTLINQIKEKYPEKIDTFSFPTEEAREELCNVHKGQYTNPNQQLSTTMDLILKAVIHEMDFIRKEDHIRSYLYGGVNQDKTLILDRWYLSNMAYTAYLFDSPLIHPQFYQGFHKLINNLERSITPSYTILLKTQNPIIKEDATLSESHLLKIQEKYEEILNHHPIDSMFLTLSKSFSTVEALTPNTFAIVEHMLKERGFL